MGEVYVWIMRTFYAALGYIALDVALTTFLKGRGKKATSNFAKDLKQLKGTDGYILAKKQQLSYAKTKEGIIGIGPTGEGKSNSVKDNLLSNKLPKSSFVINDLKGELWEQTSEYQRSIGRLPLLYEPLGGKVQYNPLDFAENFSDVRQIATDVLTNGALAVRLNSSSGGGLSGSDATWINMAVPLLTASLLYHKDLGYPNDNISTAVKYLINNGPEQIVNDFSNSKNNQVKEQYNVFSMSIPAEETMGSILSTLATNTTLFLDDAIAKTTTKSDFSFKMLREKPVSLYIKYNPMRSNYLSPFISVFYSQFLDKLMNCHFPGCMPVLFFLDEFQNLGKISNMVNVASLCRYADMPLILFVQSLSRMYDIYGMNETRSIINNLKTKLIFPSLSDLDTNRTVSELSGFTEVKITEGNKSYTDKKKLLEHDEVRRLPSGKVLIIAHNLLPILADQLDWFLDDDMLLNRYI
jgi:type IV secretion system protein VirD4